MDQQICPFCKNAIPPNSFFCPDCGKKLNEPPQSTSVSRQIYIYLISALLPPFGLWWALKYLKQNDPLSKKIGIAIIAITVFSLIVTLKIMLDFTNTLFQSVNYVDYQNLGY